MNFESLESILMSDTPSALIKENEEAVFALIPELGRCKGFRQNNPWHIYDVYEHILKVVDPVDRDRVLRFAALFHDVGKPDVYHEDENGIGHFFGHWEQSCKIFQTFSEKYELDVDFTNSVLDLIFYHDINFDKLTPELGERISETFDARKLRMLFALKRADLRAQNPAYHDLLTAYDRQEKQALERLRADM